MQDYTNFKEKTRKNIKESVLTYFVRLWSTPCAYILSKTPITPNQVSILSLLFVVGAGVFFSLGTYKLVLWGALLSWIGVVLDHSDGELARFKEMQSDFGAWFDGVLDRVGDIVIIGGMSIHLFLHTPELYSIIIGLFAIVSTTMWRLVAFHIEKLQGNLHRSKKDQKAFGFDVPLMYILITVSALFNNFFYLLLFFSVVMNLAWIKNVILIYIKHSKKHA